MRPVALAISAVALLAAPAAAEAHSIVRVEGGVLKYLSSDVTSLNKLTVSRTAAGRIRLDDPTADGGVDSGSCVPISTQTVECPADGVTRLYIEVGELDDSVSVDVSLPAEILAGPGDDTVLGSDQGDKIDGGEGHDRIEARAGNDQVSAGEGKDRLAGGDGDDDLRGGRGEDTLDGQAGVDIIRALDSFVDAVACGDGADKAEADPNDSVLNDCERITNTATADGAGDTRRPVVTVGGLSRVRFRGSQGRVYAATDEEGLLSAGGSLRVGGRTYKLRSFGKRIDVAGAGAALLVELPAAAAKAVRATLRRGRTVTARVEVYAVDAAGNRSRSVIRSITLTR